MRHGESTFNRASKMQASFAEPFIFDAELTELGAQQARDQHYSMSTGCWLAVAPACWEAQVIGNLTVLCTAVRSASCSTAFSPALTDRPCPMQATSVRETLRKLKGLRSAVWVVSPLERTIQTFMRACPYYPDLLQGDGSTAAGAASPTGAACSVPGTPEVVILRCEGTLYVLPALRSPSLTTVCIEGLNESSSCTASVVAKDGQDCCDPGVAASSACGTRHAPSSSLSMTAVAACMFRDVAEHCVTSGDIGSPASLLRDRHPQVR